MDNKNISALEIAEERFIQQKEHHIKAFSKRLDDGSVEMWFDSNNADFWGNTLPLEVVRPIFNLLPKQSVLTLGDGKGGKDGRFFHSLGHEVTCSDIAEGVLVEAQERGLIDSYLSLNAEAINLADESYDWVITKETLHHLPRPYKALYEMFRVAKKGCVLFEPHHQADTKRHEPPATYEDSGNYLYRFSTYELTMIARAYGFKHVAFGYGRMVHVPNAKNIRDQELECLIEKTQLLHKQWDEENGVEYKSLLIAFFFKSEMSDALKEVLETCRFKIRDLA